MWVAHTDTVCACKWLRAAFHKCRMLSRLRGGRVAWEARMLHHVARRNVLTTSAQGQWPRRPCTFNSQACSSRTRPQLARCERTPMLSRFVLTVLPMCCLLWRRLGASRSAVSCTCSPRGTAQTRGRQTGSGPIVRPWTSLMQRREQTHSRTSWPR